MKRVAKKVAPEVFNQLRGMDKIAANKEFEKYLDVSTLRGYGYYGIEQFNEENNEVIYYQGSYCD